MTTARTTERHGTWRRILGWGLLLWVLSAFVTAITANLVLVPTLVVLGSFLAQVTCTRHLSVWSAQDGAILGATGGLRRRGAGHV